MNGMYTYAFTNPRPSQACYDLLSGRRSYLNLTRVINKDGENIVKKQSGSTQTQIVVEANETITMELTFTSKRPGIEVFFYITESFDDMLGIDSEEDIISRMLKFRLE